MKHFTFATVIISVIVSIMTSCHTTKTTTQVVTQSVHDTLYLNKLQYDSIFISQDNFIDRSKDTILIRNSTIEYRYKLLRDTVCKTRVDSIPVVKETTVTQEVERPLTWFDHLCRWCFVFVIIVLIIELLKFFLSHRTQIYSIIHKL